MISVEEILEYLNSDRVEDMTEEMHECSMRQSQAAIKQTMELNTKYHTPEKIVSIIGDSTMIMTIGDTKVNVDWEDNQAVEALKAMAENGDVTIIIHRCE